MGMDIHGKKPTSEVGEYIRFNIWSWHPLAEYLKQAAPNLIKKIRFLHSNDGDGLNKRDSIKLAEILEYQLKEGFTEQYLQKVAARKAVLPLETCPRCDGTKKITEEAQGQDQLEDKQLHPRSKRLSVVSVTKICHVCNGKGQVQNFALNYDFDLQDVKNFAAFLRDCGGFRIC